MKEIKLKIIHFHPIEKYPPLQNLINYITEHRKNILVKLITTNEQKTEYIYSNQKADIKRINAVQGSSFFTLISFMKFTLFTLFDLLFSKPDKLLYYESISSFPVFIYTLLNSKIDLYIHYHEYTTKEQYREEMRVSYFSHYFEKYLYKKAKWISHTNKKRLELFAQDNGLDIRDTRLNVLPNYPPKAWQSYAIRDKKIDPQHIRLVYIGSLSMVNMYSKELFEWIVLQNGRVTLDIYSINIYDDVKEYLIKLNTSSINIHSGIFYPDLPNILNRYDVGLILYKTVSSNYLYNETNKFFEYLSCGLDVWYPLELILLDNFSTEESLPKIIRIDFKSIALFNPYEVINRNNLKFRTNNFYCEITFTNLILKFYENI